MLTHFLQPKHSKLLAILWILFSGQMASSKGWELIPCFQSQIRRNADHKTFTTTVFPGRSCGVFKTDLPRKTVPGILEGKNLYLLTIPNDFFESKRASLDFTLKEHGIKVRLRTSNSETASLQKNLLFKKLSRVLVESAQAQEETERPTCAAPGIQEVVNRYFQRLEGDENLTKTVGWAALATIPLHFTPLAPIAVLIDAAATSMAVGQVIEGNVPTPLEQAQFIQDYSELQICKPEGSEVAPPSDLKPEQKTLILQEVIAEELKKDPNKRITILLGNQVGTQEPVKVGTLEVVK